MAKTLGYHGYSGYKPQKRKPLGYHGHSGYKPLDTMGIRAIKALDTMGYKTPRLFSGLRKRLQYTDSLMDCRGAQEEPEVRPGGPGGGKRASGIPSTVAGLRSLLALPGLPSTPSRHPYLEPA